METSLLLEKQDLKKLREWDKVVIKHDDLDSLYLNQKDFFRGTLSYEKVGENSLINSKQFVGIIKLPGSNNILSISPKTASKYMDLFRFAQEVKCNDNKKFFYYDFNQKVDVEEGKVFFEIIAHLFIVELKKILKKGLYKEYVRKHENLRFLKGKLDISSQIKKNFINPRFSCKYYDLTVDNFTNQSIFYAAVKLTKFIHTTDDHLLRLKKELIKYINLIKDEISLRDIIIPSDLISLSISRKNEYYKDILDFTKIIITESFFESIKERRARCCNFLLDMNVVFERIIFGLLNKILKDDGFEVKDQSHYPVRELIDLRNTSLQIIPDITILKNRKEYAVIDAKYKSTLGNSEYYQIIIYSLALKLKENELKRAILINFEDFSDKTNIKDRGLIKIGKLKNQISNIDDDIQIFQISMYLGSEDKGYLPKIEDELRTLLFKEKIFQ